MEIFGTIINKRGTSKCSKKSWSSITVYVLEFDAPNTPLLPT